MVETLKRRSALEGVYHTGRHGLPDGAPGVTLGERRSRALVHIECPDEARAQALGLSLPGANAAAETSDVRTVWLGPNRWLATAKESAPGALARDLAAKAPDAAVNDVSSSRAVLRLSGPKVRDTLAAGCPLDLDPIAFKAGMAATTVCDHFTVTLDCIDAETFDVYVARGYAVSFWEWLLEAGAEYGVEVTPAV